MNIFQKLSLALPLLLIGAHTASAIAPANSTITNTATLTYTGNATGISATVDVGVTLAAAAPTLSSPTGITPADNTVAENQSSVATYLITANSNGPDTYNLTQALNPTSVAGNSANATFAQAGAITSVVLGATAAAVVANAGAASITVPADGAANLDLNGIANGDEVKIGVDTYLVNVTDNANGTSTLTLIGGGTLSDGTVSSATLTNNVPVGTPIAEQQVFTMNIADVGAINGGGSQNVVVTTATSLAGGGAAADTHVTFVVAVTVEKFVRNVTTANGAGGTLINGQTYFLTVGAVSSTSGETLEYLIRVTADAAAGIAGATITDPVPTFTAYVASSTRLNAITVAGDGAVSPLVAGLAVDDDGVRVAGGLATGNVAAASVVLVTLQVTVG